MTYEICSKTIQQKERKEKDETKPARTLATVEAANGVL